MGSFDSSNIQVGTGLVGAPACGDVMKLQIKVNKDGIVTDAKFKTFGHCKHVRMNKPRLNSELHMVFTQSLDILPQPAKHNYPTMTRSVMQLPYCFWASSCSGNCCFFQIRNYLNFEYLIYEVHHLIKM